MYRKMVIPPTANATPRTRRKAPPCRRRKERNPIYCRTSFRRTVQTCILHHIPPWGKHVSPGVEMKKIQATRCCLNTICGWLRRYDPFFARVRKWARHAASFPLRRQPKPVCLLALPYAIRLRSPAGNSRCGALVSTTVSTMPAMIISGSR